jgi:hypothetical protein
MKRRTLLQWLGSAAASLPWLRVDLHGEELSPGDVLILRDVARTVLPSAIGAKGQDDAVDELLRWLRDYKEGVPLSHGYGEPRLVRTGPSPAPRYASDLAGLEAAARGRGGRFGALPLETRRALLDAAFTAAGVRAFPARPDGKHVVADLMALYFRSSAANDLCYNARIGRHTYRAIRVTTVRPRPLAG